MNNKVVSIKKRAAAVIILFAAITTIGFILSCAPPAVKVTALIPARFHEASKLKEVAVLPFDGTGGKEFASEIEGRIASINIGDKQYFSIVDRTKLERIIDNELRLSQSGFTDPQTAVKAGKAVGAKGVYTGAITKSNVNSSPYTEERSECVAHETKYDKKGRAYQGKCIRWRNYTVSCTKRVASFAFTPKLIEVETGRVVYANNVAGTATSSACSDKGTLQGEFELIEEAKNSAKASFRKDIAPYYVTFDIRLMESTDGITSKDAEKKFQAGLDFAKNSRLDRACELWGEARILSPDSPSISYNLGICSEATGELEQALDLYKNADRLLNKPDEKITAALNRVSSKLQQQKKLSEQLGK